ncbi:hypothetical protein DP43_5106 [Burkholderia pseudomallei]|nr:hypothetical protein DP43_5106 [Burkholderia pseudomallei]
MTPRAPRAAPLVVPARRAIRPTTTTEPNP